MRPMAIWRDEVKAAVNTSVGNGVTIHACLSIHVFFILLVNVVNKWLPTATTVIIHCGNLLQLIATSQQLNSHKHKPATRQW